MKLKIITILSFWLLGLLGSGELHATIYRLGWWGQPVPNKDFGWNDYAGLEALANANDTVQVYPPNDNPTITVTKSLRFIGFGYLLNTNNGYQFRNQSDQPFNVNFSTGSDGSIMQGVTATIGIEVNNITIRYSRIGHLHFNNASPINNITILGNWFELAGYSNHISSCCWYNATVTNLKIVNNYLTDIYLGGNSTGTIANNVFSANSNGVNLDYTVQGNSNFLIKNNIVSNSNYWQCFFNNNNGTIKNNLFAFPQGICPGLTGNGNVYSVNMSITFQNWNGGIITGDSSLRIPAGSPAINAGVNNANAATNCGIYGGETAELYKQSGIPPIPAVYALTTPTQTPTGATMACTTSVRSNNASNVSRIEYYVDTDPGYGLGTAVTITPSTNVVGATFNVALTGLSEGMHLLVIRSKDVNGNWSLNNGLSFVKQYASVAALPLPNITKLEYYIDNDPGFGLGTNIVITAGTNISNITIPVNPTNLSEGLHNAYVRSRDANGKWSLTNVWTFMKPYTAVAATAATNITKLEYYIDNDPGYGNATNIVVTPGFDISNITIPVNPTNLSEGIHNAYVRSRDATGKWSISNVWTFMKPYGTVNATPQPKVTQMEYYIDIDPGYGSAVQVALNSDTAIAAKLIPINVSGLSTGMHSAWFRTKDSLGKWSLSNEKTFNLISVQTSPSIVTNSVTKKIACAGETLQVSYDAKGTYNAGNVFNVQLSSSTGSFAAPITIGSYTGVGNSTINCTLPSHVTTSTGYKIRVRSTNPVVTGITISDSLWLRDRPSAQTITGAADANQNSSYTYSVATVAGSTWQWIAPAASITPSANFASVLWNTAGQPQLLKVVQTSQYGCVGDTSSKNVNVYPVNITAAMPSTTSPCKNSAFTVTANANGVYSAGNIFTAQLSNAAGGFASPINIGTLSANPLGLNQVISVPVLMPNVANGNGYKVRIISSLPATNGVASVSSITVSNPNMGNDSTVSKCPDFTFNLSTLYSAPGITYQYYTPAYVVIANPAAVQNGIYHIVGTGSTGCKDTTIITVNNFAKPNLGSNQVIAKCASETYNLTGIFTNPAFTYQYFTNAYVIVGNPAAVAAGTYNIVATNISGCMDTAQIVINNNNTPNLGPDQVKYYLPNSSYNLSSLFVNPAYTYAYKKSNWTNVINPASVLAGVYYVIGSFNTCKDTVKITVKLGKQNIFATNPSTAEQEPNEFNIIVYPNPTTAILNIDMKLEVKTRVKLEVFDIAGKAILEKGVISEEGFQTLTLDIENLANGVYILKYNDDSNHNMMIRFVKQ